MVIVSKNNQLVKEFAALKDKKFRRQRRTFLVEGEKMVREAIASGLNIVRIAVRENYGGEAYPYPTFTFGEDAFRAICDEKTPQGIVAEVGIPQSRLQPPSKSCLVLDGVSDPANVGAVIRTANAAGYHEIYLIDCADPFAPKSVRASMSGVFFTKLMTGTREEVLSVLDGVTVLAADMNGENVFTFNPPENFALCVGNEGRGLSQEVRARADRTIRIPMRNTAESLNAAVSASIAMYLLKKNIFEGNQGG